eukprot:CFRG7422T1
MSSAGSSADIVTTRTNETDGEPDAHDTGENEKSMKLRIGHKVGICKKDVPDSSMLVFKQNLPSTMYTIVRYPGYVKNTEKAIKTLGGSNKVCTKLKNQADSMTVRFRPDDPGCTGAKGERFAKRQIILRVRTKVNKDTGEKKLGGMQVLGLSESMYLFNGMMDFQRLQPKGLTMLSQLTPEGVVDKLEAMLTAKDAVCHILPTTFSKNQKHPTSYSTFKHTRTKASVLRGHRRGKHTVTGQLVSANYADETPMTPLPAGAAVQNTMNASVIAELERLFHERPVWTRVAIDSKFSPAVQKRMKDLLPQVAYVMTKGPWGRTWVRFGYDPKLDPRAKWYQVIEIRLPKPVPVLEEATRLNTNLIHEFVDGMLAPKRQLRLQLCDIQNTQIRDLAESGSSDVCTYTDGWLSKGINKEIVLLVKTFLAIRNDERLKERAMEEEHEGTRRDLSEVALDDPSVHTKQETTYALPHPLDQSIRSTHTPPSLSEVSRLLTKEREEKRHYDVIEDEGDEDEGDEDGDEDGDQDESGESMTESDEELLRDVFGSDDSEEDN